MDIFYILPGVNSKLITYAFDFDGTLTPHPGNDRDSLWNLKDEYWDSLSPKNKDLTLKLWSRLPDSVIIISKNYYSNVESLCLNIGRDSNQNILSRIDKQLSSYIDSSPISTRGTKSYAWQRLEELNKLIMYSDDSEREIRDFDLMVTSDSKLYSYLAKRWLGNVNSWNGLVEESNTIFIQQTKPKIVLQFGPQLIESGQTYRIDLLTQAPKASWVFSNNQYYTAIMYYSKLKHGRSNHKVIYLSLNIYEDKLSTGTDIISYDTIKSNKTRTVVWAVFKQQKEVAALQLKSSKKFSLWDWVQHYKLILVNSISFGIKN